MKAMPSILAQHSQDGSASERHPNREHDYPVTHGPSGPSWETRRTAANPAAVNTFHAPVID